MVGLVWWAKLVGLQGGNLTARLLSLPSLALQSVKESRLHNAEANGMPTRAPVFAAVTTVPPAPRGPKRPLPVTQHLPSLPFRHPGVPDWQRVREPR